MAVNCWSTPRDVDNIPPDTVTCIDSNVALVIVNVVLPEIEPIAAVITLLPVVTDVAKPLVPAALLIVVTPIALELHVTKLVITWVLPSLYVPVATICVVIPNGVFGVTGVIAIELNVALDTANISVPDILPNVAVTTVLPEETGVNKPLVPTVLLIVAVAVTLELHVTLAVIF